LPFKSSDANANANANASLVISATLTPEWIDHVTCDIPWIALPCLALPHPNRSTSTIKQPISRSYVATELFIRTASSISMS
jgi:hypothetical protein